MTIWTTALLIGAVVTAAINYNSVRVLAWVGAATLCFVFTYAYFYFAISWLPHAFVTGVADALLIVAMSLLTKRWGQKPQWELWVRRAYMLSVLVSMAFLMGWLPDRSTYGILLEGCNWIALLIMSGHGLLRLADEGADNDVVGQASRAGARNYIHSARIYLERTHVKTGILARSR